MNNPEQLAYAQTRIRPCDWLLPGHPDRLADAVAEILVDSQTRWLPKGYAAVDVAVHLDRVYLTGRYCLRDGYSPPTISFFMGTVWSNAGYRRNGYWRPYTEDMVISGNLEYDHLYEGEAEYRSFSDDACLVTGYANNLAGTQFMPPEHWLARQLAKNLFEEVNGPLGLNPSGRVFLELEESTSTAGTSYWLKSVTASIQASPEVGALRFRLAIEKHVARLIDEGHQAFGLEPTPLGEVRIVLDCNRRNALSGFNGGSGISGRNLSLDFYGPRVPVSGKTLWGRDWNRPDKAGALVARDVALQVVNDSLASEATVWLSAKPGDLEFQVVRIETPDGDLDPLWTFERLSEPVGLRIDQVSGMGSSLFIYSPDSVCWGLHYE